MPLPPSTPLLVLAVAGSLLALTVLSTALGFAMERTSPRKIWDVPLAPCAA
jgi:hypothetical protein